MYLILSVLCITLRINTTWQLGILYNGILFLFLFLFLFCISNINTPWCWFLYWKQSEESYTKTKYRSGMVNSNTVNSKFHLNRSFCEMFSYDFPNISCLKCTVNLYLCLLRRKSLPMNDFELTVPDLYITKHTLKWYIQSCLLCSLNTFHLWTFK